MVGGEWGKPVDGEVVDPDHKNWQINWKNPEHDYKYRVNVVVEVEVSTRPL
jgi:hypothetical protein